MIRDLRKWLYEPGINKLDVDSSDFAIAHRQILQKKVILQELFAEFYRKCRTMDIRYFGNCPGKRLEIGSGSSFMQQVYPDVITSDVMSLPFVRAVLRGEQMPLQDRSLRAIYAINVFHHIPDPRGFFKELLRVLHPGGGAILIEPYHGLVARWLFKNLHASEGFDPSIPSWECQNYIGPSSNANQALSYVVFRRDLAQFEREFPSLCLVLDEPHTQLQYFVSGGVNFRQLLPDSFAPLVRLAEKMLTPLNRWLALQHTIVLRKRG